MNASVMLKTQHTHNYTYRHFVRRNLQLQASPINSLISCYLTRSYSITLVTRSHGCFMFDHGSVTCVECAIKQCTFSLASAGRRPGDRW